MSIPIKILNFAKGIIFMSILDFFTYMACLWESAILMSHKHATYVLKYRIRMSTFKYAQK